MSRRRTDTHQPAGPSVSYFRVANDQFAVLSVPLTPTLPACLTPAEREVVALVFAGKSNTAIARARRVSLRTIANQVAASMKKLKVGSRAELIARLARPAG